MPPRKYTENHPEHGKAKSICFTKYTSIDKGEIFHVLGPRH